MSPPGYSAAAVRLEATFPGFPRTSRTPCARVHARALSSYGKTGRGPPAGPPGRPGEPVRTATGPPPPRSPRSGEGAGDRSVRARRLHGLPPGSQPSGREAASYACASVRGQTPRPSWGTGTPLLRVLDAGTDASVFGVVLLLPAQEWATGSSAVRDDQAGAQVGAVCDDRCPGRDGGQVRFPPGVGVSLVPGDGTS